MFFLEVTFNKVAFSVLWHFLNRFLLDFIPFSRLVMLEVESSQTHLRKLILFPVFKIFLTQLSDKNLGIMDFLMEYLSNLELVKEWVSKSRKKNPKTLHISPILDKINQNISLSATKNNQQEVITNEKTCRWKNVELGKFS